MTLPRTSWPPPGLHRVMQIVEKAKKPFKFAVDFLDAHAEFVRPFRKRHGACSFRCSPLILRRDRMGGFSNVSHWPRSGMHTKLYTGCI